MYKLNYFNFDKKSGKYLLTNDLGKYTFVEAKFLDKIIKKKELPKNLENDLLEKKFIYKEDDEIFAQESAKYVRSQKNYLFLAPSLHIFVVTKNCNYRCVYCQAGNLNQQEKYNMDKETAKKSVDIALSSPSKNLTFEFQGGEPLLNFKIIKYIVEYSKSECKDKHIEYNIVTNLSLLTDDMIKFIKENNIAISTSLDGDYKLQNINRPYPNNDSYNATLKGINRLKEHGINTSAIQTTTKYSLDQYKEIVDEYIEQGYTGIFIRPLTQLGKADKNWNTIGYSAEEYLLFYKNVLEYIIDLNINKNINISERHTALFLKKIIDNFPANYMELRSPCGGVLGQIAYYYNGDVYTCDEARMLGEMGDDIFKIGNVENLSYEEIINSQTTNALSVSSCIECLSKCHNCVYSPYCGTCPVVNYAQENNIFSRIPNNYRCNIYKGMIDTIFEYLNKSDEKIMEVFTRWVNEE